MTSSMSTRDFVHAACTGLAYMYGLRAMRSSFPPRASPPLSEYQGPGAIARDGEIQIDIYDLGGSIGPAMGRDST